MDKKQSERASQNQDFERYYPPPHYTIRNYPNSYNKCKNGYWKDCVWREGPVPYNPGNVWKRNYYKKHNFNVNTLNEKLPSRSSSPVEGSEEYMTRKIQHTSAIIMRHLLSPSEELQLPSKFNNDAKTTDASNADQLEGHINEITTSKCPSRSPSNSKKLKVQAEKIYEKIMSHIGNLAEGRKKNFINADNSTNWDQVINDMQKQQRLELSKILRSMNSNSISQNNTHDIPSFLEPDIGIKIEDLPLDVIEELRHTLNIDLEQPTEELNHDKDTIPIQVKQETVDEDQDNVEVCQDAIAELDNSSVHIKDEPSVDYSSIEPVSPHAPTNADCSSIVNMHAEHLEVLKSLKTNIEETIERDKEREILKLEEIVEKSDMIDKCIETLVDYKKKIIGSIIDVYNKLHEEGCTLPIPQQLQENALFENVSKTMCNRSIGVEQARKKQKLDIDEGNKNNSNEEEKQLILTPIEDKITTIKLFRDELVAGTQSGDILFLSMRDGSILHRLDVSSHPVTCMQFVKEQEDSTYMYVGTLETILRVFNLNRKELCKICAISDQIRCMDVMWDFVFMGGKNGTLIRYGCKKRKIEFQEQTGKEILVLKAAQEGPRCVLIVGHRNAPIYVRDALSGLFLRQFSNDAIIPTVYSLVLHKSHIYCGTAKDNILVFSFHEGKFVKKIVVDNFKGISCMSIASQSINKQDGKNRLFIGCYNGSVYIYDLDCDKLETTLQSKTGGSIVCMEVLSKQVVIGKLQGGMESVTLPDSV